MEALFASASNGKGAMPPRGGSSYSDDEIRSTIEYMLGKAGLMDAAAAAPAAETAAAAAPAAAPAPAPAVDATEDMMPQAGAEKPLPVADLAAGEKGYRSACFACHDAGVAGAPKLGDAPAWAARIANGADALLASVVNGKGAMPPRGGTTMSDDELRNVVAFMMSKAQ
jgi:cytochrome c5